MPLSMLVSRFSAPAWAGITQSAGAVAAAAEGSFSAVVDGVSPVHEDAQQLATAQEHQMLVMALAGVPPLLPTDGLASTVPDKPVPAPQQAILPVQNGPATISFPGYPTVIPDSSYGRPIAADPVQNASAMMLPTEAESQLEDRSPLQAINPGNAPVKDVIHPTAAVDAEAAKKSAEAVARARSLPAEAGALLVGQPNAGLRLWWGSSSDEESEDRGVAPALSSRTTDGNGVAASILPRPFSWAVHAQENQPLAAEAQAVSGRLAGDPAADQPIMPAPFAPLAHGGTFTGQYAMTNAPPQIAVQAVQALVQNGANGTEIALSPEELGHVRMVLQPDVNNPERLVVLLQFERAETMDLFRRHADQLAEALRDAGYAGADLGFGQFGKDHDRDDRGSALAADRDGADRHPTLVLPEPAAMPASAGITALDLRL